MTGLGCPKAARLTGTPGSFLPLGDDATWARYWMTFFVFSVFPAPDSPLWGSKGTWVGRETRHSHVLWGPPPLKPLR